MKFTIRLFMTMLAWGVLAGNANAQIVHLNDVVIDGSLCVGFDCPHSGVGFGFDTIRLEENNLRIKFKDTSSTASFPSNDWTLAANDSTNGGQNRFYIEDVTGGRIPFSVEANAPSNSLYVDDGGRLGLGTNVPSVELHVIDGDTPTLRLAQDGSSGFAPQTWDLAGNETNFFVRDVTGGSRLPLRIRPGAPTSSIDVAGDGDIGLGTASPDQRLDLENNGPVGIDLNNTTTTEVWRFRAGGAGNLVVADSAVSGTDEFIFSPTGDLTILGSLVTGTAGSCTAGTPCDAVFQADKFEVPSIGEHAEFMWQNSYLKAVGPTKAGEPFNVTQKTTGILHELEIAHIYIDELNKRITELEARIAEIDNAE